jgi:hypothetical protein
MSRKMGVSLLSLLAIAQSACSVTDTTGSSGLVCSASIAETKTEVPLDASAFSVPVAAQGGDVSTFANFTVTGNVVYERYFPRTSTPFGLDYAGATVAKATLPVRRAIVQVMSGSTPIASGITDDSGNYSVPTVVAQGSTLFVRVLSRSSATSNSPDGVAPNNCSGASWDIRVVNNVTNNSSSTNDPSLRAQYALDSSTFLAPAMGTANVSQMTAAITWNGTNAYTLRAGAPFALLDTAISSIETACQGRSNISFPVIYMNWSVDNTNTSGNRYDGNISTSFFTTETSAKTANLYILGKAGIDTDELDNHVVAHEFGHFLENKIYRSDSIGGSHGSLDHLDPRLAFGEGFGNAFSGMVHADPIYTDTSGTTQQSGFRINVSTAPGATAGTPIDDKGIWSEASMQYMLYHLWEQNSSNFSRIHNILENYQKTTSAATNGLTFASYYAQVYGQTSEDLTSTWSGAGFMSSPMNALCTGSCSAGSPVYSPFDTDNDLGFAYASGTAGERHYKQQTLGSAFPAPFWQVYRPLVSGVNAATTHDKISLGGYSLTSSNLNKFGLHRLYTVTATSSSTTVSVSSITQGGEACNTNDLLDMAVYGKGVLLGADETTSGATANCPKVTFCSTAGQTYVIDVIGFGTVNAYNLSVSP